MRRLQRHPSLAWAAALCGWQRPVTGDWRAGVAPLRRVADAAGTASDHGDGPGEAERAATALRETPFDRMEVPAHDDEHPPFPPAAARGLLQIAFDITYGSGFGLYPEVELWEPLVHDQYPPAPDEPVIEPRLDDERYAGREDLVRKSAALLDCGLTPGWSFDLYSALGVYPPGEVKAADEWTDNDRERAITLLAPLAYLATLRHRLQRGAFMLDSAGDTRLRDTALAVSASLRAPDDHELTGNPLLLSMAGTTLTSLSAMAEALGTGDLSSILGYELDEAGLLGADDYLDQADWLDDARWPDDDLISVEELLGPFPRRKQETTPLPTPAGGRRRGRPAGQSRG